MQRFFFHSVLLVSSALFGVTFSSDMFSSIAELESLYSHEQELVISLERYLNRTKNLVTALEKYLV